jgi:hypothetical protein
VFGEHLADDLLRQNGWDDFAYIKNFSDNGIDIVARGPNGQLGLFEVKTGLDVVPNLSVRQASMTAFVDDVLSNAANGTGRFQGMGIVEQQMARSLYLEFTTNPGNVSGTVIGVDLGNGVVRISSWPR